MPKVKEIHEMDEICLGMLKMTAQGKTHVQIAFHFMVSTRTVRRYLDYINRQFGVRTTIEAVVYAVKKGLI
jgi:DNA-binding NarL/FixJ family response regulator